MADPMMTILPDLSPDAYFPRTMPRWGQVRIAQPGTAEIQGRVAAFSRAYTTRLT
jgi:hypothetical protein